MLLFLTDCASAPPKGTISQAETAIQDADRAGASPYEPQLLGNAPAKLGRVKKDMDAEENDEARRMAEDALAEAKLANAKDEAVQQAKETDERKKAIEALLLRFETAASCRHQTFHALTIYPY